MYRIGIDLGGTNIAAGLVDRELRILDRLSRKTNAPRPLESVAEDMAGMVGSFLRRNGLRETDVASVGVGVPCTANEDNGHMEDADWFGVRDAPFLSLLRERIALPVYFGNDANAAAWGEYLAGGYHGSLVMVTLGTGIGGGIVLDGKLWRGTNFAAGEFGHMTIRAGGEECFCGRRGCFERYCSATALIQRARQAMERDRESALWRRCGGDPDRVEAKTVFDGAADHDPACLRLLDEYTTDLAEGLANIINILQPDVLCVGGGVSRAGDALLLPLREKTAGRVYSRHAARNTRIELARLDNDAGIVGAALLDG